MIDAQIDQSPTSSNFNFEKFLCWLNVHLEEKRLIDTLGANAKFKAKIGVGGRSLLIEYGSQGKSGELSYEKLKMIWDRYIGLGNMKNTTSEFNDPKWPETPNRILAPYAAALIRDFENDFKNRSQ